MYPTLANSTPIRNSKSDQPGVHFNTNPVHHIYATTSDGGDQYEPPKNNSILQGATSSPVDQFTTNTTDVAGRNEPWRRNNATNTSSNTINHRTATRPTSRKGLQNDNSPNTPDLRNGPTCFRCGEQGHMRAECRKRVFCNHCRSYNHNTKACRETIQQYPEPHPQSNSNRLLPNSDTTTINGNNGSHTTNRNTQQPFIQLTRQQPA